MGRLVKVEKLLPRGRIRAFDQEEALAEAVLLLKDRLTKAVGLKNGNTLKVVGGIARPCDG